MVRERLAQAISDLNLSELSRRIRREGRGPSLHAVHGLSFEQDGVIKHEYALEMYQEMRSCTYGKASMRFMPGTHFSKSPKEMVMLIAKCFIEGERDGISDGTHVV